MCEASGENILESKDIFVVYGMPRSGTTFLYQILPEHPNLFVPHRKETHFFSVNYEKGLNWYANLFSEQRHHEIGVDVNPMYYLDDNALSRMLSFRPNMKVVLGVREPVDFAASLYGNMCAFSLDPPPILEMIQDYSWPIKSTCALTFSLADGIMQRRVTEMREALGKNLLLYDFSLFRRSPLVVLQAIEEFIGLPSHFCDKNFENVKINASTRLNSRVLNRLIGNQEFLEFAYRVIPSPTIRLLRRAFERIGSCGAKRQDSRNTDKSLVTPTERRQLESVLAEDIAFYRDLFRESQVVLGNNGVSAGAQ